MDRSLQVNNLCYPCIIPSPSTAWSNLTSSAYIIMPSSKPRWDGSVVSVSASNAVGLGFVSRQGHTQIHHQKDTNYIPAWHACVRVAV